MIIMILKMAAVRYLGFLKLKFLTAVHFRDIFYIMKPNFVEIGHMLPLAETSQFFAFLRNIKKNLMIALCPEKGDTKLMAATLLILNRFYFFSLADSAINLS